MLGSGKHIDESPKHQLKAPLGILWRKLGHGRLFTDDVLQLRDELDNEQSVWIQCLA